MGNLPALQGEYTAKRGLDKQKKVEKTPDQESELLYPILFPSVFPKNAQKKP